MTNEERNVATKWRFCKEKHVCVMWKPLFAKKIMALSQWQGLYV
jgi:hypothetical protein